MEPLLIPPRKLHRFYYVVGDGIPLSLRFGYA